MINIYCDGACSLNPGPGGWCYLLITPCGCRVSNSGGEENTTNNRMELKAVVEALRTTYGDITVVTDSAYVVNAINKKWLPAWKNNGWKKNNSSEAVSNVDLWKELDELLSPENLRNVTFTWIKGHSNNPENDFCDKVARKIARSAYEKNKPKKHGSI